MLQTRGNTMPINLIVQMPNTPKFPEGSAFANIGRGMRDIAKHDGVVVVVVKNQFHRSVIAMFQSLMPLLGTRLYSVPSLEAARRKLGEIRQRQTG
jgi:hypothetical protein